MITIYFTRTREFPVPTIFTLLLSQVPDVIREKVLQYRSYQDRVNSLIGKLLLAECLNDRYPDGIINLKQLAYTEQGKPYFHANIDFNISHSGNIVVFSVLTGARIGVDIEEIKPADFNLMRDQFTTNEWYKMVNSGGALADFYRTWVRKEALVKAIGLGLAIPLHQIDTSGDAINLHGSDWHLHDLFIADGYVASIATNAKDPEIEIMEFDIDRWIK